MALEATPASVASDGNLRVTFVPSGSNPLSVAILAANTSYDITYSLTPSGFNHTINEQVVADPRLTLKQTFNSPGTTDESLVLQYVWSTDSISAYKNLPENTAGFFVVRVGIPNATAWTAGQKVDVMTILTGKQRKDAPTANGLFTVSQNVYIKAVTQYDSVLIS